MQPFPSYLSWNLVTRLIRIFRIHWWYLLFPFSTRNTFFRINFFQKIKIISLSWNLVPSLIPIFRIQGWCSFFCFKLKIHILGKFFEKIKIISLNWNLVPRLILICRIQWWCSFFRFRPASFVQKIYLAFCVTWYIPYEFLKLAGGN